DEATLTAYDERAHLEAESAPGFLHYLKGPLAADRTCLSFCLWTDRAHARAAAARSAHREAVALTAAMYERYELEYVRVWREVRGGVLQFAPYAATGGGDANPVPGTDLPAAGVGGWAAEPSPS
ncbi:MAG: hypothetical protein ACJ77B_11415, partial [Chloroflexota bacterium]